jgi:hypothetical protein
MGNNVQRVQFTQTWLCAVVSGRRSRLGLVVLAYVLVAPALAHAHGGMSGDELGPPLMTSGLLGFLSYWLVVLWPSSHKKDGAQAAANQQLEGGARPQRRGPKSGVRRRRRPHLRVVQPGEHVSGDQQARRKASDG